MPYNTSTHRLHCPHGQGISSLSNAGKYRCSACQYFHKRFLKSVQSRASWPMVLASQTPSDSALIPISDAYTAWLWHCKKKKKNGSTLWYVRKFRRRFRGSRTWTGASSVACDLFLHRPQAHTRAQDKAGEGDESSTMTKVEKKNSVKANGTKMFANKAETRVMFGHKEKKTSACLSVFFKVMLTFW